MTNALSTCSLFSGIAGIELGLRSSSHLVNRFVESDPAALAVLGAQFPDVACHDDVRTLDVVPDGTDLITAGFPCQDISQAGRVSGLEGARSRLVEHVFRLVERRSVEFVLLENVAFLLRAKSGRVLDDILSRFEALKYRWAYRVVDSQAFGVPQRRDRVYLLASRDEDPRRVLFQGDAKRPSFESDLKKASLGFYWSEGNKGLGWAIEAVPPLKSGSSMGGAVPPAIVTAGNDVIKPNINDAERLQGFRAGWTKAARTERDRWRLVGNAVTVPVARWIGKNLAEPRPVEVESITLEPGSPWPVAAFNVSGVRRRANVSTAPVWMDRPKLTDFLQHDPVPLSARATEGFLRRARASNLTFPPGFLDRLDVHLERVSAT